MIQLCRTNNWVLDLQQSMIDGHTFDEGPVTQIASTLVPTAKDTFAPAIAQKQPTPSPSKKKARAVLSDITGCGVVGNIIRPSQKRRGSKTPSSSPEKMSKRARAGLKTPGKVFKAGKRGILDGRPILRDIYNEAV